MHVKSSNVLRTGFFILLTTATLAHSTRTLPSEVGDRAALNPAAQARIIDWVCGELNANYVFPDLAAKMEKQVRRQLKAGAYRQSKTFPDFLQALTRDLVSVCEDPHLRVSFNPDPPPPDTASAQEKEKAALEKLKRDRSENFYFRQCQRLPGNVGYVRLDQFTDACHGGATAVAAMNFLAHCDALIFDLRFNGGGSGTMIQLLASYFFDEPVHLSSSFNRSRDVTAQDWTSAFVPGPKMTAMDLYVLTSDYTFSAAEAFTYALKNQGRATIVGDTTRGGAHPAEYHYQREWHVELKIPNGRTFNPKTGLDWEGTGIAPDINASPENALDVAHTLALKNLYLKAPADLKEKRKWDWQYQEARINPAAVDGEILKRYAGRYGPLRIGWADGGLQLFEPGQDQPKTLCPLSDTLFVIDGNSDIRVQFEKENDGSVTALMGIMADGTTQRLDKSE